MTQRAQIPMELVTQRDLDSLLGKFIDVEIENKTIIPGIVRNISEQGCDLVTKVHRRITIYLNIFPSATSLPQSHGRLYKKEAHYQVLPSKESIPEIIYFQGSEGYKRYNSLFSPTRLPRMPF